MDIKTLFPIFYEQVSVSSDSRWTSEFDFSEPKCSIVLEIGLEVLVNEGQNYENQIRITTSVCQDLLNLQKEYPEHLTLLRFLQFQFCSEIALVVGTRKLFSELFQWVTNALGDDVSFSVAKEASLGRLSHFMMSKNPYINSYFYSAFVKWSRMLFYQQRIKGGLKDVVKDYIEVYFPYLKRLPGPMYYDDNLVSVFCEIQKWASNNRFTEIKDACSHALLYFYSMEWMPISAVKIAAMQFCTCGWEYTAFDQQGWCDLVLTKIGLTKYELVQILSAKFAPDVQLIKENLETFMIAIAAYHQSLDDVGMAVKQRDFETSRIFSVIYPILDTLLKSGEIEIVLLIIGNYFKIPEEELYFEELMMIQQNVVEGVRYGVEGNVVTSGTDPLHYGPLLIAKLNQFLSQTISVIDDFEFSQSEPPEKVLGMPSKKYGKELEEILVAHFCLEREDIKKLIQTVPAYFLLAEFQLPLQPLFLKYCNVAIPIVQTFRVPHHARILRKVLIWQGDLPMAQYECDGLQQVFQMKGIEVVRYNWYEHSSSDFATAYKDDSYDLVWMSCHGQFDHFMPHNSFLILNRKIGEIPEQQLCLQDLGYERQSKIGRRLLVLNACDGATTTLLNSPGSVGFGSSLVSPAQSLMSHQWPIDDYAGLLLGLMVGISLANGCNFISAYTVSLSTFLRGQEAVVVYLKETFTDNELFDRIEYSAKIEYDNLYYYGSLTYLE